MAVLTLYNSIIANSMSTGNMCYGANVIKMASCWCRGMGFKDIRGNKQSKDEYYRFVLCGRYVVAVDRARGPCR